MNASAVYVLEALDGFYNADVVAVVTYNELSDLLESLFTVCANCECYTSECEDASTFDARLCSQNVYFELLSLLLHKYFDEGAFLVSKELDQRLFARLICRLGVLNVCELLGIFGGQTTRDEFLQTIVAFMNEALVSASFDQHQSMQLLLNCLYVSVNIALDGCGGVELRQTLVRRLADAIGASATLAPTMRHMCTNMILERMYEMLQLYAYKPEKRSSVLPIEPSDALIDAVELIAIVTSNYQRPTQASGIFNELLFLFCTQCSSKNKLSNLSLVECEIKGLQYCLNLMAYMSAGEFYAWENAASRVTPLLAYLSELIEARYALKFDYYLIISRQLYGFKPLVLTKILNKRSPLTTRDTRALKQCAQHIADAENAFAVLRLLNSVQHSDEANVIGVELNELFSLLFAQLDTSAQIQVVTRVHAAAAGELNFEQSDESGRVLTCFNSNTYNRELIAAVNKLTDSSYEDTAVRWHFCLCGVFLFVWHPLYFLLH